MKYSDENKSSSIMKFCADWHCNPYLTTSELRIDFQNLDVPFSEFERAVKASGLWHDSMNYLNRSNQNS